MTLLKYLFLTQILGDIVKITMPYLNIINQTDRQLSAEDQPKSETQEILKYQYKYDLIIKKFISNKFNIEFKQIQDTYIKYGEMSNFVYNIYSGITIEQKDYIDVSEIVAYKENLLKLTGNDSNNDKLELFEKLIGSCNTALEVKYIIKIFLNKLNIGFSEKSLIKCLKELKHVINDKDRFDSIMKYLETNIFKYRINYEFEEGASQPGNLKPGQFVNLMLCRPGENMESLLKNIKGEKLIIAETKYDGERCQLHFDGNSVTMGSRSFENQSTLYGHLRDELQTQIIRYNDNAKEKIKNFILDGEIVCFSLKAKSFVDFQELRKKQEGDIDPDKKYLFIAFDILALNDRNLTNENLVERKIILKEAFYNKFVKIFVENCHLINLATIKDIRSILEQHFHNARKLNCEGLVIKEASHTYEFGKRRWHKVFK
jgi:DNA ligase-1